nr:copia protein [Tanacetum cinerariifolium]
MFLTHSDEALEIEKFKRARENKIEFAYDYGNLNASYVNEKIKILDDYFQEIINPDFAKIDSSFQKTSSLKPYVPNVTLEKIIIDLEDEVSENAISESENQSENDCQVVEKGDTRSAYACNDAMNVYCNSSLYASNDENDLFIFADESVRNSQVGKMPFRKKPRDSMNVRSKSTSNKSLPRTVHMWFPKMQQLSKPVAKWIPKVKRQIDQISKTPKSSGPVFKWHMTGNRAFLTNFVEKFLGTVCFGNNDFAVIAGYGDVGLEVAFRKSTCFVRNKDGVDLLTGDRSSNLYTIALNEIAKEESNLSRSYKNYAYICKLTIVYWAEAIATACFTKNHLIIHKHFDKTPHELMNKKKPNIKFFQVFGCKCYLFNDYDDVGKLKAKGDIRVFVRYSKESTAFRIYNNRTSKIHKSMNVIFDEISKMVFKQFSLEHSLSNLNETGKYSNPSVSQVSETSKKDLEDLFHNFYDEYFDASKIMKSSTMNVETSNVEIPSHKEEVFHKSSELFQEESSSSSLNEDIQKRSEEVRVPSSNTQSVSNNMVPNVDEVSISHNVFNERLEDAYFDVSTSFHDPFNVHTFYQPYPHEKKWTMNHPLHKQIGDLKSSVRTRDQLASSCLFSCLLSSIEPANVAEALRDADWVSSMQDKLDQFARLKV